MADLPRLALGSVQDAADSQPTSWALMALLAQAGFQVQHFFGRGTLSRWPAARAITGVCSRHLDSWLMSRETCQEVFAHGIGESEWGIVEGTFDVARPSRLTQAESATGARDSASLDTASLDTLSDWLDLPRLAVVDAARLKHCVLPRRPKNLDGVLLERCADAHEFFKLQTWLEAAWGVPVLGGLTALDALREQLAKTPWGAAPATSLLATLGRELARFADVGRLSKLASRRAFPLPAKRLFRDESLQQPSRGRKFTVAVAYDSALNCYFPDAIDLLELRGASIAVFSPLRDEQLPANTDLVFLGCGHPELHAADLANNQCMLVALRRFIHGGGRVYGEGGGMAYLAEHVITPAGTRFPMIGALPITVRFNQEVAPVEPVELSMPQATWLAGPGELLRGYRNPNWLVQPACTAGQDPRPDAVSHDLVSCYQAIGSRIQLNFATQPAMLDRLMQSVGPRAKVAPRAGSAL